MCVKHHMWFVQKLPHGVKIITLLFVPYPKEEKVAGRQIFGAGKCCATVVLMQYKNRTFLTHCEWVHCHVLDQGSYVKFFWMIQYIFIQSLCYRQDEIQHHFFKVEYSWFEFRVFILLDCRLTWATEPSFPYYLPHSKEEEQIDLCFSQGC